MMLNIYFVKNSKLLKIVLTTFFLCLVICVILFSVLNFFKVGYVQENGKWVYVTIDEGNGKQVEKLNVDNATFLILTNKEYAKDKNSVFHYAYIMKDADTNTFEIINDKYGYAKDAKYVYIDGVKVIGANPKTFVYLEYPYSKDDKHVYCGTLPMFVNNVEEFKVIESGGGINQMATEFFLESNPKYSFIDTKKYDSVLYADDGKGETKTQKFQGYKQVP